MTPVSRASIQALIDTGLVCHLVDADHREAGSQALPQAACTGGGWIIVICHCVGVGVGLVHIIFIIFIIVTSNIIINIITGVISIKVTIIAAMINMH